MEGFSTSETPYSTGCQTGRQVLEYSFYRCMAMRKRVSLSRNKREKIEYLMNVALYCWAIWISKVDIAIRRGMFLFIRFLVLVFLPKRYVKKYYRRYLTGRELMEPYFTDVKDGWVISTAKDILISMYLGYLALPFFTLMGIMFFLLLWLLNGIVKIFILLPIGLLIFIVSWKFFKYYDTNLAYIPYFKEFEKKDEGWLKKWKRKTILLYVGSIIFFLLGLGMCFLCVKIARDLFFV